MKPWQPFVLLPLAAVHCAQATDYLSVEAAQSLMFAEADSFIPAQLMLNDTQKEAIKKLSGVRVRDALQQVWRVSKGGTQLGWFYVDNVIGKHELITYALATDVTGKVLSIEVLSYRETHGGQVRNPVWRQQFSGKTVQDAFKLNKDIDNISGATLSCRNLTDGIKRLLATQFLYLQS